MEPYWNDVRTAQVKGRAVRICSHAELPPAERTVDIFTYVSVFSSEAQLAKEGTMKIDEKIRNRDSLSDVDAKAVGLPIPPGALQYTLTSDQRLWLISNRKKALIDNLQRVMKSAAVDCRLNYEENKEEGDKSFKCKTFAYKQVGDFLYDPSLERDIEETRKFNEGKKEEAKPAAPLVAKPLTVAPSVALPVPPKKKLQAKIQDVTYFLEAEVGTDGKPVKYYLYAESDKEMKTKIGEVLAVESKTKPGTYGPKSSTLKLY
jgi:hypothetical protein